MGQMQPNPPVYFRPHFGCIELCMDAEERAVLVPTPLAQAFIRQVQQDTVLQKYVKVVLVYNDGK